MILIKSEFGEFLEFEFVFWFVGGDFFVLVFFLNMCFLWIVLLKGEMILKNFELEFEIMKVKMLLFNL